MWRSFKRLKVFLFCALQSSVTCIIIRVSMHYAVFCVFKSHISLALNSKQQALCTQRLDFSILNGANSEPVSCNCCSWCCLWLINELVNQREDLRSHWKFWPISLLYPPKEHNSDKNTPGENKNKKKVAVATLTVYSHKTLKVIRVCLFTGRVKHGQLQITLQTRYKSAFVCSRTALLL